MAYNEEDYDKKYCYPGTNVLINKLNIMNNDILCSAERELTSLRLYELEMNPIKGNFDLNHLQKIHKYIFQDLYDWAGEIRTVNIAKDNLFCPCEHIHSFALDIEKNIKKDQYLLNLSKQNIPEKLSYYLGEINALHPFREGNGRTQRIFIEYLANISGYTIDFSKVSKDEMLFASKAAFNCNYDKFISMFSTILNPITKKEQQEMINCIADDSIKRVYKKLNEQEHEL